MSDPHLPLRAADFSSSSSESSCPSCRRLQQGLRALPYAIAQLRHLYKQLRDLQTPENDSLADGLLAPQIRKLEALLAAPDPPDKEQP